MDGTESREMCEEEDAAAKNLVRATHPVRRPGKENRYPKPLCRLVRHHCGAQSRVYDLSETRYSSTMSTTSRSRLNHTPSNARSAIKQDRPTRLAQTAAVLLVPPRV